MRRRNPPTDSSVHEHDMILSQDRLRWFSSAVVASSRLVTNLSVPLNLSPVKMVIVCARSMVHINTSVVSVALTGERCDL